MKQLTMWRLWMDEVDFMDALIATQNRVLRSIEMGDVRDIMKSMLMLIGHLHDRINTMEMEVEPDDDC